MKKIISESMLPVIEVLKERLSLLKILFIIISLFIIYITSADTTRVFSYSTSFLLGVILGEVLTR